MRMRRCEKALETTLHRADEMVFLLQSNLRSYDLQGRLPAGGKPWSGSGVQLCLWSLISEEQLSSFSSLWVVTIRLIFVLLEPEV